MKRWNVCTVWSSRSQSILSIQFQIFFAEHPAVRNKSRQITIHFFMVGSLDFLTELEMSPIHSGHYDTCTWS
jgi:hypothetical protein